MNFKHDCPLDSERDVWCDWWIEKAESDSVVANQAISEEGRGVMGYTKLFSSIVASTIWREDDKTRLVWITMLAMKNERHVVEASVPGLADLARVTIEECEMAIRKLEGPDRYSRNQEHEGRRIVKCQGGWAILNGEYYRQQLNEEDRREYKRNWQAEYRKRRKDQAIKGGARQALKEGF